METASEDTPKLSGHLLLLLVSILVIVILCSSISRNNEVFKAKRQAERYTAVVVVDLVSLEVMETSYVHMDHLMVIKSVDHAQMSLVMELLLILPVTTCSLTRKMLNSQ
jgi:hypothetical protein